MKIKLLWVFLKFLIVGLVVLYFMDHPGAVSLEWGGWHISTSLTVLLLNLVGLSLVISALKWLRNKAADILHFSPTAKLKGIKTGIEHLERALLHTWLGSKERSLESIKKAQGYLSGMALPKLLGHHIEGRSDLPKLNNIKDESAFKMLSLLRQHREDKNWDVLEKIFNAPPKAFSKDGWFWHEAYLYHMETHNWSGAQEALDRCANFKACSKDTLASMQSELYSKQGGAEKNQLKKLELFEKSFKSDPKNFDNTLSYAKLLKAQKETNTVKKVLMETWKANPAWSIAEAYAELTAKDSSPLSHSHAVRELHDSMPKNTMSHICLALSLLKAKLWGEAAAIIDKIDTIPEKALLELLLESKEKNQNQVSIDRLKPFLKTLDTLKVDINTFE